MSLGGKTKLIAATLVLGYGMSISAIDTPNAQTQQDEPIAFIGHGALFGPSGNELSPTFKFIDEATRWYIAELAKDLNTSQRTEFSSFQKSVTDGLVLDEQSRLLVNTTLIDWLLDHSTRQDVHRIRGKNRLLREILRKKLTDHSDPRFPRGAESFNVTPELAKRLAAFKPNKLAILSETKNGGAEYRAECAASGVPLPPDFGAKSAWTSQGIIPKSELFIVRGDDAEVLTWTSDSPKGMCIALPRFNVENTVEADGVICVSKITSKVCFWDNQVKDGEGDAAVFPFTRGTTQPFSRWAGGTDLRGGVGGVCSDCHAGENPYVIHGDLLMKVTNTLPTTPPKWYDPIVRTGDLVPWPQNPGPMDAPSPCIGCHGTASESDSERLPKISSTLSSYCGAVLRPSLGALAPPLPGKLNAPPSMPQGKKAGTLACTPGLSASDPRYRPCSADTTFDCTPVFGAGDDRIKEHDFPAAYKVNCTKEMDSLLKLCAAH